MKGVILCAGYGERLKPFTNFLPKPLFPILGIPIINNVIAHLKQTGVEEICINTHHLSHSISQYVTDNSFGIKIHKFYEASLLGGAGGIGSMRDYLYQEDFIVSNCDILTNIDLKPAIEFHEKEKSVLTLILHDYPEYNKITLSPYNNIVSIDDVRAPNALAFTGISIMSPKVFDFMPYKEYGDIHDTYRKLITIEKLKGYVAKGHYWIDIGTLDHYLNAHKDILVNRIEVPLLCDSPGMFLNVYMGKNSYISPLAQLKGFVSIGNNCKINDNVRLENCVVWDNVEISEGREESNTIIYASL